MDCFKSRSGAWASNSLRLAAAALGLVLLGCAQPKPVVTDPVMQSGLDETGRPIAFRYLPKSLKGDTDWVAAIKDGSLKPKGTLDGSPEPAGSVLNMDIVFNVGDGYPMPNVVFPHAPHTMWLGCNACHPAIFAMKQGANPVSMDRILRGEFCGRCHGVVAFPVGDCFRCHSRPKAPPP